MGNTSSRRNYKDAKAGSSACTPDILPPEMYDLISAYLPLSSAPTTLRALSLTNTHVSNIVIPILWANIVLRNEHDALQLIRRLVENPEKGQYIRGIHIRAALSDPNSSRSHGLRWLKRRGRSENDAKKQFGLIEGLEKLITAGSLPFIHSLELRLDRFWSNSSIKNIQGQFEEASPSFWRNVNQFCPQLRRVVLRSLGDQEIVEYWQAAWVRELGVLEIKGVTDLDVQFTQRYNQPTKVIHHLSLVSSQLRRLSIGPRVLHDYLWDTAELFELTFPVLESISLGNFESTIAAEYTDKAVMFWERHPTLESIHISPRVEKSGRFIPRRSDRVPQFLPRLRHLEAPINDVFSLLPILHQLVSLSVLFASNESMDYLTRSLPSSEGLPRLRSITILHDEPAPVRTRLNFPVEGVIDCITAAAPNVEELAYISSRQRLPYPIKRLTRLKRLFYRSYENSTLSKVQNNPAFKTTFEDEALAFGRACPSLESYGLLGAPQAEDHPKMLILRGTSGKVVGTRLVSGAALEIGMENEAFPRVGEWYYVCAALTQTSLPFRFYCK
ncbi:hypothetical protein FA15DRAFT_113261 [Coprinopsis marcescibilis]|uniref:Uncharacterized protein n=1 Tax=Coprinopsis marcescibilis TaxID=230819 RepID=A0A5C3KKN0_COPMA|nr:hypothetical protein FA15DRAFT_113261 [Coprinopsis marcescibilis]